MKQIQGVSFAEGRGVSARVVHCPLSTTITALFEKGCNWFSRNDLASRNCPQQAWTVYICVKILPKSGQTETGQSFAFRSRKAFMITDTELKVIAALAIIGESRSPKTGNST